MSIRTYEFFNSHCKNKKKPHRCYKPNFHTLVGSLDKIWRNQQNMYEMCITLKPGWRSGYSLEEQEHSLREFINDQCRRRRISYIATFEYSKKGYLHSHLLVRSASGYEKPLRLFQSASRKKMGRTSLSEINDYLNYFTYIFKDLGYAGMYPEYDRYREVITEREHIAQLKEKQNKLLFQYMSDCIKQCSLHENEELYRIPSTIYGKIYKYIDYIPDNKYEQVKCPIAKA